MIILWEMITQQWGRNVARWNLKGLNWRAWSFAEMLWTFHAEQIEYLREHEPNKMRRYLMDVGDEWMLTNWDHSKLGSKGEKR